MNEARLTPDERQMLRSHADRAGMDGLFVAVDRIIAGRIAQARREAWSEGWLAGFANCDERSPATPNPYRAAALRGDA